MLTQASDFPECDCLSGRKRQICRNEAGLPLNGPHSVNSYRMHWGIEPWGPLDQVVHKDGVATTRPARLASFDERVGTNLALLLKRFDVPVRMGCGCEEWIKLINSWDIDTCVANTPLIVERLKDQAAALKKNSGRAKMMSIGLKMIVRAQWPSIHALVRRAIKEAKKARARKKA